jgi:hypothetical protein
MGSIRITSPAAAAAAAGQIFTSQYTVIFHRQYTRAPTFQNFL